MFQSDLWSRPKCDFIGSVTDWIVFSSCFSLVDSSTCSNESECRISIQGIIECCCFEDDCFNGTSGLLGIAVSRGMCVYVCVCVVCVHVFPVVHVCHRYMCTCACVCCVYVSMGTCMCMHCVCVCVWYKRKS